MAPWNRKSGPVNLRQCDHRELVGSGSASRGLWPEQPVLYAYARPLMRPRAAVLLRFEAMVILGLALSVVGVVLARIASRDAWHPMVPPATHGPSILPKALLLSNEVPVWVVEVLVLGLGALWTGCGWALLRRHKHAMAPSSPSTQDHFWP